jgi:pimeloyl-ACP methyl ester carboxylesterase
MGKNIQLVFLHHALGSAAQWKGFAAELAAQTGLSALVTERRGHGGSGEWPTPRGLHFFHEEALEWLPQTLREAGVERPLLVGHSDGATIALLYAAHFPTVAVIAEAPHILVEPKTREGVREALLQKEKLIAGLEKYHGPKSRALVEAWSEQWLSPAFENWNIEAELAGIACPTLLIQGNADAYGSMRHVERVKNILGERANILEMEGGGHFLHHEARGLLLGAMNDFIRNHSMNIP